jgi:hypothetical protein
MPIGNASENRATSVLKIPFILFIKKLLYLKKPSDPTPITTEDISAAFAILVPRYFSMSNPCIYPEKELPIRSNEYIGSPAK